MQYTEGGKKLGQDKERKDAEDIGKTTVGAVQDDAGEVLRNMQFSNMSGCTFNFTLR